MTTVAYLGIYLVIGYFMSIIYEARRRRLVAGKCEDCRAWNEYLESLDDPNTYSRYDDDTPGHCNRSHTDEDFFWAIIPFWAVWATMHIVRLTFKVICVTMGFILTSISPAKVVTTIDTAVEKHKESKKPYVLVEGNDERDD